jgi:hypothetical protein
MVVTVVTFVTFVIFVTIVPYSATNSRPLS